MKTTKDNITLLHVSISRNKPYHFIYKIFKLNKNLVIKFLVSLFTNLLKTQLQVKKEKNPF